MLQREVYFPWSRRNRYGPAQTPHGPLISLIVAGPQFFKYFVKYLVVRFVKTTLKQALGILTAPRHPIRAHFVKATPFDPTDPPFDPPNRLIFPHFPHSDGV